MTDQLSPLDATEARAWRALAYFFVTAPRFLDEDLQRSARMSLSAYTILMHLSEAPERTLRIPNWPAAIARVSRPRRVSRRSVMSRT